MNRMSCRVRISWLNYAVVCLAMMAPTAWAQQTGVEPASTLTDTHTRLLVRLQELVASLPLLGIAFVVLLLFWLVSRWLGNTDIGFSRIRNPLLRGLVRQVAQTVTIVVGILVGLEIMNAMALAGAVLGTAGVVGLAVGFAFKDVVENYLAGVLLSMRQPFAANDLVELEGFTGKVVRLTSRATILMTLDGNHVRIPNAVVFKSPMTNYSRNPLRRFDFVVGVGGGEDLNSAQQLGIDALRVVSGVLTDPAPSAILEPPGDSSIGVHFFAWINQSETSLGKAQSAAIRRVTQVLGDAGIDMPEPIYRVHVGGQSLTITESDTHPPERAAEPVKPASPSGVSADGLAEDTSVNDEIDEQIQRDRAALDHAGDDLLRENAPLE